jgi:segregation and condensation protein B
MSGTIVYLGNVPSAIEALLFVSPEPIHPSQFVSILGISLPEVEEGLSLLEDSYKKRGLRLQYNNGRVQLTTAPEMAEYIEYFLGLESTNRLSRAALDTLAIIAYQQPVTRPFIEGVRGVSSDGVMKSLLGKGLVQEVGRADGPGRPILYGTTSEFLQYFGINNLSELPSVDLSLPEIQNDPEVIKG